MPEVKILPSSPNIESDVVGACLAEGVTYWTTVIHMGGSDTIDLFHNPELRMVVLAIQAAVDAGRPLNVASVTDELIKDEGSDRLSPSASTYVNQLRITSNIRDRQELQTSLNVLIEHRSVRNMVNNLEEVTQEIMDGNLTSTSAAGRLRDVSSSSGAIQDIPLLGESITALENESSLGVPWRAGTGLTDLDAVLNGGYEPRRFYLIGARPKVGKSMILFNGALEALSGGATVLFVSMELSNAELWTKMLASYSGIKQKTIQGIFDGAIDKHSLPPEDIEELDDASNELRHAKLHSMFVRDVRDGVNSIISAAMALRLKYGEDEPIVIFVDYIQLLVKSGFSKREEIEDASRKLKLAALEFNLCVVAAAQVNRASASNEDGMPRAFMLRDSGSLEQDADVVMMLNRPFLQDETQSPDLMHVFVELNRTGESGKWVDAKYLPEYQQLADFNLGSGDDDDDEPRQTRSARSDEDEEKTFEDDDEYPDLEVERGSSTRTRRSRYDS